MQYHILEKSPDVRRSPSPNKRGYAHEKHEDRGAANNYMNYTFLL